MIKKLSGGGLLSSAATGAGMALMIKVGGTGIAYLSHLLFAWWLGAAEYGSYIYTLTWAKLLALLSGLGFTTGVLRFIPEYLGIMDLGRLRGLVRRSQQMTFLGGLTFALLGSIIILAVQPRSVDMKTLMWGMWLIPLLGLVSLQGEMILGARRIVLSRFPNLVAQPALCIAIAYVILKSSGSLTSLSSLAAFGLATLLLFTVQVLVVRRVLTQRYAQITPVYSTSAWLRVSLPLLLITGFDLVLRRADIIIIGIFMGDKSAGVYNVASQTAMLVSFVFIAINSATAPMIASLYSQGDHESLQKLVRAASKWMFWPSLGIILVLIVWGKSVLALFGMEFVAGWLALSILALGHLAITSVGLVTYLLSLTGHQDMCARVFGVSATLNIVLNIVLIPYWGLEGAAFSTMCTMIVWNVWLHFLVMKHLGINSFVFSHDKFKGVN